MNNSIKLFAVLMVLVASQQSHCQDETGTQGKTVEQQLAEMQQKLQELLKKEDDVRANARTSSQNIRATGSKNPDTPVSFDQSSSPSKKETNGENADRELKFKREHGTLDAETGRNSPDTGVVDSASTSATASASASASSSASASASASATASSPSLDGVDNDRNYDVPEETAPVYSSSSKKIHISNHHQTSSYSSNTGGWNHEAHSESTSESNDGSDTNSDADSEHYYDYLWSEPEEGSESGHHDFDTSDSDSSDSESSDSDFSDSDSSDTDSLDSDPEDYNLIDELDQDQSLGENFADELPSSTFDSDRYYSGRERLAPVNKKTKKTYIDTSDPSDPKRVKLEREVKSRVGPNFVTHEQRESKVSKSFGGKGSKTSKHSSSVSSSFSSSGHNSISRRRMKNFAGGAFSRSGYYEDPTDFTDDEDIEKYVRNSYRKPVSDRNVRRKRPSSLSTPFPRLGPLEPLDPLNLLKSLKPLKPLKPIR